MAHFDRGVYQPSDEVRVFDGSEDDEDVEGSRLPLLIVLALLVLAMFGGVVWLAYTQGVARGRTETPVLTAQNGPARIAPTNPGGAEQPYKGFKIYEQPAPPDDEADGTAGSTSAKVAATSLQTPGIAAAPPKAAPPQAPPAQMVQAKPAPVAVAPAPKPAPVVAAPKPAFVEAPPKAKAVAAAPVAPASTPAASISTGPATAAPRSLALVPPKSAATAPAASTAATPAATETGAVLQIGAYKSQADADTAWKTYKAKHSALLSGAAEQVQQADLGDKGTWYRLRIIGFPSKDVASAMCDRLKADGGVCLLGK